MRWYTMSLTLHQCIDERGCDNGVLHGGFEHLERADNTFFSFFFMYGNSF